mgnify:CR=1 FL=1
MQAELIGNKGPWRSIDDVEVATAEWVNWYNITRPHSAIDMHTPVEHETAWTPLPRHRHQHDNHPHPATTGTR